jgi:hypothetical protein
MCLNNIHIYFHLLKFPAINYLIAATFFYQNATSALVISKSITKNNILFSPHKFFIVGNFAKNYLHKNTIFSSANVFAKSIAFVCKVYKVIDYSKFFKFFFLNFFRNQKLFFCSFKTFFFEFLNFNSFLHNAQLYVLYKPLFEYYQEKKNRSRFKKLINIIYKKYHIKATVLFDYKYSSFFLKILEMSNTVMIGFNYIETSESHFHYSIFVGSKDVLAKHVMYNQIFDIYKSAVKLRYEYITVRFIVLYRFFY